jgi:hypothetical protein
MSTCAYIGDSTGCAHPALAGKSYCEAHYAVVYRVGSGRQRRKDTAQAARVRLVEQLMSEAVEELIAEGFDVYGDTALAIEIQEDVEFEEG